MRTEPTWPVRPRGAPQRAAPASPVEQYEPVAPLQRIGDTLAGIAETLAGIRQALERCVPLPHDVVALAEQPTGGTGAAATATGTGAGGAGSAATGAGGAADVAPVVQYLRAALREAETDAAADAVSPRV